MLTGIRSLFVAALLVCGSSHALVVNMGANPVNESIVNTPSPPGGSFQDTVLFSVTTTSSLVTTAFSNWPVPTAGLRNLAFELFQGTTLIASTGASAVTFPGPGIPVFTLQSLSQALEVGSYRLALAGDVRPDGGFYAWTVSTVAVPEPEQWALMAAGLVLVIVGVSRRRKPTPA